MPLKHLAYDLDSKIKMEETPQSSQNEALSQAFTLSENQDRLVLREVESPEKAFLQLDTRPVLAFQRDKNQHIILTYKGKEHKIYQIKDQSIQFVSRHRVEIPIQGMPITIKASDKHLRYYFSTREVVKFESNQPFFQNHNINPRSYSRLVFEFPYGIGQPWTTNPWLRVEDNLVYGDLDCSSEAIASWRVDEYLDSQKTLIHSNLCLINASPEETVDRHFPGIQSEFEIFYLSRVSKGRPHPQRIFKFDNYFDGQEKYENNLRQDSEALGYGIGFNYNIQDLVWRDYCKMYSWRNDQSDQVGNLKPFIQIRPQMISVLLLDLRTRKTHTRAFVSIFELFQGQEFAKIAFNISYGAPKVRYSLELDTLIVELEVFFSCVEPSQEELKAGREDRKKIFSLNNSRGEDGFRGSKLFRFTVKNLMKRQRRSVWGENLSGVMNSTVENIPRGLVHYQEDDKEVLFLVATKAKAPQIKEKEG